jgi:hypothetical protein
VNGQEKQRIWNEFVDTLLAGKMSTERIKPHEEFGDHMKETLLGFLEIAVKEAFPEEWNNKPEIITSENKIHYILPLTTKGEKIPYCFTFLTEQSNWYFHHLEAIFIRLDTLNTLPASTFPDISERQKAWAREEIHWSFVVLNVYLPVARDKGKEYALGLLKDGGGYFVGAKTWVPFSPPHIAFIQYLCWEQAKLRGNSVELISLDDRSAEIHLQSQFIALYSITSHLRNVISFDDFKAIFETIWQDRATNAGWKLEISYQDNYIVEFHFTR